MELMKDVGGDILNQLEGIYQLILFDFEKIRKSILIIIRYGCLQQDIKKKPLDLRGI